MDAARKLDAFLSAVSEAAEKEVETKEQEAERSAEEYRENAMETVKARSEKELSDAKNKITAKYRKAFAQVGYRGKTALLSSRQALLGDLFSQLREKIVGFTDSPEYVEWLGGLLRENAPKEQDAVILVREKDLPLQEKLRSAAGISCDFRVDKSILLGGLSILSADGRRCENHTLDEAYASQYRDFYRHHKLSGGDE